MEIKLVPQSHSPTMPNATLSTPHATYFGQQALPQPGRAPSIPDNPQRQSNLPTYLSTEEPGLYTQDTGVLPSSFTFVTPLPTRAILRTTPLAKFCDRIIPAMPTLSNSSLKVLIVGAGPAGLCAATALRQDGHIVTVIDRQRSIQTHGNALVIQPAAVKALAHLNGAHEALNKVSVQSNKLCYWTYKDERPFATTKLEGQRFETDRPSVQRELYKLAIAKGVKVLFGKNVEHVEDIDEKAKLFTSEGEIIEADLIIGADGIKSAVRKCLFPKQNTDPIPIRESIFLATIPVSEIRGNPRLAGWLEPGTTHGTLGPGRFILSRPLPGDMFGVQFIDVDHGDPSPVDSNWNTPADMATLRALFADFNPITRSSLETIERAEKWQIAVGPELETWRSKNGRVVLLGDAAHAMIPHAAQGLSQGIEDGISLARILRGTHRHRIPVITEAWVRLRKPRADIFVQRSMNNAKVRSLPDGPEQITRDRQIAMLSQKVPKEVEEVDMDMTADQNSPQFMKWVREYDVVVEAEKAVKSLV